MIEHLQHGSIRLALHQLRTADGHTSSHPLLLLHGLGESHLTHSHSSFSHWPGPVYALDFTGHGMSTIPSGGGYSCEVLMGDVDTVLAHIGPATICGRGLGAYVALLIAGARPHLVRGAILLDGPGLAGTSPSASPYIPVVSTADATPPDPFAIAELATDPRPPEYAVHFALLAAQHSPLPQPIAICTRERPPWLAAVREALSYDLPSPADAYGLFARSPFTFNPS
ncbi:MAG: alpha/beta fold hydrolase [Ottowia sp.]|uniref:alpha/beta hydrolase n=1 Tax=Ottowia sp. TaxID=1898956 RepID=UPI003C72DAAB